MGEERERENARLRMMFPFFGKLMVVLFLEYDGRKKKLLFIYLKKLLFYIILEIQNIRVFSFFFFLPKNKRFFVKVG